MPKVMEHAACNLAAEYGASAPDATRPFESEKLLEEWCDNPGFVVKIISAFMGESRNDIENLAAAFECNDPARMASYAHRLKGAAATIEAEPLRAEAARLESLGRAGETEQARASIDRLRAEFERLRDYVAQLPLPGLR
jgi:HPt (histidine-containing phosphotransfer) domain-containing protein